MRPGVVPRRYKRSTSAGVAIEASLNFPAELAFDRGNLYIADRNNHRVRKVDSQGIITTVAGNGIADYEGDDGPATEASLHLPSDVVCDRNGNLYISDRSNNSIRKVDTKGIITTYAGLGVDVSLEAIRKYQRAVKIEVDGETLFESQQV